MAGAGERRRVLIHPVFMGLGLAAQTGMGRGVCFDCKAHILSCYGNFRLPGPVRDS